jgi:hypothetical protein
MSVLRQYIRQLLIEQDLPADVGAGAGSEEPPILPKGQWVSLGPGDERRPQIQQELFDIMQLTYADIGGHFKVGKPADLERYNFWVVQDLDGDDDPDVAIFGKPDVGGVKMGGAANDGSPAAASAYKEKSAQLRAGAEAGGSTNWWGEVSGKPAYAMIKRGAPAVTDEQQARTLLAGDDIVWHGKHPDPNAPSLFKSMNGWYSRKIGGHSSTKIILGSPSL